MESHIGSAGEASVGASNANGEVGFYLAEGHHSVSFAFTIA
jgi:hypothetical protein